MYQLRVFAPVWPESMKVAVDSLKQVGGAACAGAGQRARAALVDLRWVALPWCGQPRDCMLNRRIWAGCVERRRAGLTPARAVLWADAFARSLQICWVTTTTWSVSRGKLCSGVRSAL